MLVTLHQQQLVSHKPVVFLIYLITLILLMREKGLGFKVCIINVKLTVTSLISGV